MCHPLASQARPSSAWDALGGGQKRWHFTWFGGLLYVT
jgi:hypothetical protein